jgi:hypothetical protein
MQQESALPSHNSALRVIVRAYGDRPFIRRVISITDTAVFVCREESYDRIVAGELEMPMAGFPLRDVFQFDETAAAAIAAGRSPIWDRLRPISGAQLAGEP